MSDEPYFTVCGADKMSPETLAALAEVAKLAIENYKSLSPENEEEGPDRLPFGIEERRNLGVKNRAQRRGKTVRNIESTRRPFGFDKR